MRPGLYSHPTQLKWIWMEWTHTENRKQPETWMHMLWNGSQQKRKTIAFFDVHFFHFIFFLPTIIMLSSFFHYRSFVVHRIEIIFMKKSQLLFYQIYIYTTHKQLWQQANETEQNKNQNTKYVGFILLPNAALSIYIFGFLKLNIINLEIL